MARATLSRLSTALSGLGESSLALKRTAKLLLSTTSPATRAAAMKRVFPSVEHLNIVRTVDPRSIVDIGANYGQFALAATLGATDLRSMLLVEPNPEATNVLRGLFPTSTTIVPRAVGPGDQSTLYITRDDDNSSIKIPRSPLHGYQVAKTTSVQMTSLDALFDGQHGSLPSPTLMKIDVQGMECEVLESGQRALNARLVDALIVELTFEHSYSAASDADAVIRKLHQYGYGLRTIWNVRRRRPNVLPFQCDALFAPT